VTMNTKGGNLKRIIGLFLLGILTASCGSIKSNTTPTNTSQFATFPTARPTSTDVPTLVRDVSTATASATPTPPTFVLEGTPAQNADAISVANVQGLVELARWGREAPFGKRFSEAEGILFGQTTFDLTAFDALTKAVIWRFDVPAGIDVFAISDAAQIVAVVDDAGSILLLDMVTGELVKQWDLENDSIIALEFSRDGNWLASSSWDYVYVWKVPEGELVYNKTNDFNTNEIRFFEDRLVVGRNTIYELETGVLLFNKHILNVSEENRLFLDEFAVVRTLETGEEIRGFPDLESAFLEAGAISLDGTRAALLYNDYPITRLKVFEIATGNEVQSVDIDVAKLDLTYTGYCYGDGPGPFNFSTVMFSADGMSAFVFASYREVIQIDLVSGLVTAAARQSTDPLPEFPEIGTNGQYLDFSRDGSWLVSGENLWELASGNSRSAADAEFLRISSDNRSVFAYKDGSILRYGLADMELKNQIWLGEESRDECSQVKSIAPNGSIFFEGGYSGGDSYISIIWELTDRAATLAEPPLYDTRLNVVFTSDSKNMIVSAHSWSEDTSPEIVGYELFSRREIFSIDMDGRPRVEDLAVSQGLTRLAVVTFDDGFVWDLTQLNKPPVKLVANLDWQYNTLAISPDGALVALQTDAGPIAIWNAASGVLLHEIERETRALIYDIAFSPDGTLLAAVASDGLIYLWGIPSD
jgi:WD40 repeat protein